LAMNLPMAKRQSGEIAMNFKNLGGHGPCHRPASAPPRQKIVGVVFSLH
jgi:hypothetical protein